MARRRSDPERLRSMMGIAARLQAEKGVIRPKELGEALILAGVYGKATSNAGDNAVTILMRHGVLQPLGEQGKFKIPADVHITTAGDEMIGIPPITGLRREDLFQLRQVAASYARMVMAAEENVSGQRVHGGEYGADTNPALAELLRGIYQEVSRQIVMLELVLESNHHEHAQTT